MFQILSENLVSICPGFDTGFALLNPGFSDRLLVETSKRAKHRFVLVRMLLDLIFRLSNPVSPGRISVFVGCLPSRSIKEIWWIEL